MIKKVLPISNGLNRQGMSAIKEALKFYKPGTPARVWQEWLPASCWLAFEKLVEERR